jgi:hypothetical protein
MRKNECNRSVPENAQAIHVSFARPVSFGHLPEAPAIMNCFLLPKTEPLPTNPFPFFSGYGKMKGK